MYIDATRALLLVCITVYMHIGIYIYIYILTDGVDAEDPEKFHLGDRLVVRPANTRVDTLMGDVLYSHFLDHFVADGQELLVVSPVHGRKSGPESEIIANYDPRSCS